MGKVVSIVLGVFLLLMTGALVRRFCFLFIAAYICSGILGVRSGNSQLDRRTGIDHGQVILFNEAVL